MTNDTEQVTLTSFLLARIEDDEAAARAVDLTPDTRGVYQRRRADGLYDVYTPEAAEFYVMRVLRASEDGYPKNAQDAPASTHFARHDPARVLAECEAKRRIVELHEASVRAFGEGLSAQTRAAVKALAAVYSDHPEYRAEWA